MAQRLSHYRLIALSVCAIALLAMLAAAATPRVDRGETTVIVVRHAEKDAALADDPALSEAGQKRAAALRHALEKAGVTAIFATQFRRTQQTVEPLAKALKIPVTQVDAARTDRLVEEIRQRHRGRTVLVAGHSNTVPEILKGLGAEQAPAIGEGDFDDLFVACVGEGGRARVVHLRYGRAE